MENKLVFILLLLVSANIASAWELEDVNGTYMYDEEHLQSPLISEKEYSWGKGKRLPETAIEFDLGLKTVLFPGFGKYLVETVSKDGEDSFNLVLFYVGDTEKESPSNMKFTFIDAERVYIVHDNWIKYRDKRYSPEEKWVWYRLSGPAGL